MLGCYYIIFLAWISWVAASDGDNEDGAELHRSRLGGSLLERPKSFALIQQWGDIGINKHLTRHLFDSDSSSGDITPQVTIADVEKEIGEFYRAMKKNRYDEAKQCLDDGENLYEQAQAALDQKREEILTKEEELDLKEDMIKNKMKETKKKKESLRKKQKDLEKERKKELEKRKKEENKRILQEAPVDGTEEDELKIVGKELLQVDSELIQLYSEEVRVKKEVSKVTEEIKEVKDSQEALDKTKKELDDAMKEYLREVDEEEKDTARDRIDGGNSRMGDVPDGEGGEEFDFIVGLTPHLDHCDAPELQDMDQVMTAAMRVGFMDLDVWFEPFEEEEDSMTRRLPGNETLRGLQQKTVKRKNKYKYLGHACRRCKDGKKKRRRGGTRSLFETPDELEDPLDFENIATRMNEAVTILVVDTFAMDPLSCLGRGRPPAISIELMV